LTEEEKTLLLRVDESVSPKALDFIFADASGKPLKGASRAGNGPETETEEVPWMAIYKFEGTKLTIAITADWPVFRPTEFKAAIVKNDGSWFPSECRVVVVTLERVK
jgi:uncharacterized protein (TIGR03067 family)